MKIPVGLDVLVGRGVPDTVLVGVTGRVGVFVKVERGRTTNVYVGGSVGEAVRVIVGVSEGMGVGVMAF